MPGKRRVFIKDFTDGDTVDEVLLVREANVREARNGSLYVQGVLADSTGRINLRQWDAKEEHGNLYPVGGFVRVQGRVETYRSQPQLIVKRARPAREDEFDPADLTATSGFDLEALEAELLGYADLVQEKHLKALLEAFFHDEERMARFRAHPAGSELHHPYRGGLLEHTTMLVRSVVNVCAGNPRLNRDILITGAMLHDVGKMEEISADLGRTYTDSGRLMGHLVIGVLWIEDLIRQIPDFPHPLRLSVHHLILSHHGSREFGSPVLPATPEAVALHHLDNLDAKIEAAVRAIDTDTNPDSDFTTRQFMFNNVTLYKLPRRSE